MKPIDKKGMVSPPASPLIEVPVLAEAPRIAHSAQLEVTRLLGLLRTNGAICKHRIALLRNVEDEPFAIALPFLVGAPLAQSSETPETAAVPPVAVLKDVAAHAATLAKSLSTPSAVFVCTDPDKQAVVIVVASRTISHRIVQQVLLLVRGLALCRSRRRVLSKNRPNARSKNERR